MMKKRASIRLWAAFILYCLIMLWLLFGQRIGWSTFGSYPEQLRENSNLIPFRTLLEFLSLLAAGEEPHLLRHAVVNLLGNVGVFIPLGFFLPCLWPQLRHFGRHALCLAGLILLVELLQLFSLLGSFDIDDLLLNLLGTSIGYLFFRIRWAFSAKTKGEEAPGGLR